MMEYRKAIKILMEALKKYNFTKQEEQAIRAAIGTLDWGAFAKSRAKRIIESKRKKDKEFKN